MKPGSLTVGRRAHRRDRRSLLGRKRSPDHASGGRSESRRGDSPARGAFKPHFQPLRLPGAQRSRARIAPPPATTPASAIVTEVMTPHHVEHRRRYADVLQIGARNMQNYHLLQAVGEPRMPVLLERGPSATIEEFLSRPNTSSTREITRSFSANGASAPSNRTPASPAAGDGPVPARTDPPADHGRPQPRHRESPRWFRRCRPRRSRVRLRRTDHRSPPESLEGHERRRTIVDASRLRSDDANACRQSCQGPSGRRVIRGA